MIILGVLILEAQSFSNYGKRKNLSETILKNFKVMIFIMIIKLRGWVKISRS